MFIFFVFMFDTLLDPLFNRFKKPKTNEASLYKEFFQKMTYEVNEQCDFTIEDFRRLRENEKFQKGLQQAFKIKNNGETNELNFVLLEKKFKKNKNVRGKAYLRPRMGESFARSALTTPAKVSSPPTDEVGQPNASMDWREGGCGELF